MIIILLVNIPTLVNKSSTAENVPFANNDHAIFLHERLLNHEWLSRLMNKLSEMVCFEYNKTIYIFIKKEKKKVFYFEEATAHFVVFH